MSSSPLYSFTAPATTTVTVTISSSGIPSLSASRSVSSTASATWSPISSTVSWSAIPTTVYSTAYTTETPTAYTTLPPMQTPTALWSPVLPPTAQPSQAPQAEKSSMTTENYLIAATIVLGVMLFLSIIHTLHYNKKYIKEKRKRSAEVRSNPLHSQVRSVLPN